MCCCVQDKDASKRITAALPSTTAATDTAASAETTDKPEATETVTINSHNVTYCISNLHLS